MDAVGQLTGGIAHDFNNMLTGVLGSLDLMQPRLAKGRFSELERFLGLARAGAERAAALTRRLLIFSQRQLLTPQPVDGAPRCAFATHVTGGSSSRHPRPKSHKSPPTRAARCWW